MFGFSKFDGARNATLLSFDLSDLDRRFWFGMAITLRLVLSHVSPKVLDTIPRADPNHFHIPKSRNHCSSFVVS